MFTVELFDHFVIFLQPFSLFQKTKKSKQKKMKSNSFRAKKVLGFIMHELRSYKTTVPESLSLPERFRLYQAPALENF